jgi:hypothetical protein
MKREYLRSFWINADPAILCRMLDGTTGMLIIGPSDSAVARGDWRFGFQVHGERDIRWRGAEQLERHYLGLIEVRAVRLPAIRYEVEYGTAETPYTLIAHWTGPDRISDLVIDFVAEPFPTHLSGNYEGWGDGTPSDLFDGREL